MGCLIVAAAEQLRALCASGNCVHTSMFAAHEALDGSDNAHHSCGLQQQPCDCSAHGACGSAACCVTQHTTGPMHFTLYQRLGGGRGGVCVRGWVGGCEDHSVAGPLMGAKRMNLVPLPAFSIYWGWLAWPFCQYPGGHIWL